MQQRIEQQLEGGRWAQIVQQLQDVWLRRQSLASTESRGLGSHECCQHAEARRTWSTEGQTKVTATQGQAICPLFCSLCHVCCLILQYCKAPQLPTLATWQLTEGGHIDHRQCLTQGIRIIEAR